MGLPSSIFMSKRNNTASIMFSAGDGGGGLISLLLLSCAISFIRYRVLLNVVLVTVFTAKAVTLKLSQVL